MKLRIVPVNNQGELLLDEYEKLFTRRTRFVSLAHVSNALGTITPVNELVEIAHRHGVRVLVDGAQAISHIPVDVQANNAYFYFFPDIKFSALQESELCTVNRNCLTIHNPGREAGHS